MTSTGVRWAWILSLIWAVLAGVGGFVLTIVFGESSPVVGRVLGPFLLSSGLTSAVYGVIFESRVNKNEQKKDL